MRTKVAILFGGPSSEHEVSLSSAKNVITHINTDQYEILEIFIDKEGMFDVDGKKLVTETAVDTIKQLGIDVVFPILHGSFGEDGTLQKVLEEKQLKFVGSGSKASALAMDKDKANTVFELSGLHVPSSQIITASDEIKLKFPVIIKPIDEGSSVGLFKIENQETYKGQKEEIFKKHTRMLAQECIIGREFTCGVIDIDTAPKALPISEIILNQSKVFDYDTKYTAGACLEITPAKIDIATSQQIQDVALTCHKALGCKSISRTDVILSSDNKLYVLETNTLPGMTETSFIPTQAAAMGMDMKMLITRLIESALSC